MKIALITDEITSASLGLEVSTKNLTPLNYKIVLKLWMPDFLFVESCWEGYRNKWKFGIASYPGHPKRNNNKLQKVVKYAKKLDIQTVFWNKEDGVHFDRFIDSAKHFDHIFTVDKNCISKYMKFVGPEVTVNTLMFAVQSKFHNFTGFDFKYNRANFAGSYSHHIHVKRRIWQDMIFHSAAQSGLGLTIFDRNSDRNSKNYRYPELLSMRVKTAVEYKDTAKIYKDYLVSINVNTIEDSETMFSRRLVEILACGGIVITNSTQAVEKHFKEFCHIISNEKEALELFERLKYGPSESDLEHAKSGAEYIAKEHTWTHRLKEICVAIRLEA